MSRQRREMVRATLLGEGQRGGWPRLLRVGLVFPPGTAPLTYVRDLCASQGYPSLEDLRRAFTVPAQMLTCRPARDDQGLVQIADAPPAAILEQALVLGLCTATYYDPRRPVLWTTTSLTRRLDLFAVGAFYADD